MGDVWETSNDGFWKWHQPGRARVNMLAGGRQRRGPCSPSKRPLRRRAAGKGTNATPATTGARRPAEGALGPSHSMSTPNQEGVSYRPPREVRLLYYPAGGRKAFLLPNNKPSQLKGCSSANEKPSYLSSYFSPMNFHFSLAEDFRSHPQLYKCLPSRITSGSPPLLAAQFRNYLVKTISSSNLLKFYLLAASERGEERSEVIGHQRP